MDAKLAQIAALGQKDKGQAYLALSQKVFSASDLPEFASDVHKLVDAIVNQDSVVVGRQVLAEVVKNLTQIQNTDFKKQLVQDTLDLVQPRIVSYEEQASFASPTRLMTY